MVRLQIGELEGLSSSPAHYSDKKVAAHQVLQELVEGVVLVGQDEDGGVAAALQERIDQLHPDEGLSGALEQDM